MGTENEYFSAGDLTDGPHNLKYGVANIRRKAFVSALRSAAVDASSITGADRARARVIEGVSIKMATNID